MTDGTTFAERLSRGRVAVRGGRLAPWPPTQDARGDDGAPARASPFRAALAGAALNKSALNKNKGAFNKSLNKNKNKNKGAFGGGPGGYDPSLVPAQELLALHRGPAAAPFPWELIDLEPPPGPDETRAETERLLDMQADVAERERRRPDVLLEATLDVSAFTRPLGVDGREGYAATESLFLTILTLCEYVGLVYKARIGRPRPNQIEPRLRPLLPTPAHLAYPSNHAFQCYSIVHAFAALLPEHPATNELFRVAARVAENREWAGLHYASDTAAGRELARRFAPYLAASCADAFAQARADWI